MMIEQTTKEDIMTNTAELNSLIAKMSNNGCDVTCTRDAEGRYTEIAISGAKGIGPFPMSPISAAERMREFLAK
jgi:hypothetical protein